VDGFVRELTYYSGAPKIHLCAAAAAGAPHHAVKPYAFAPIYTYTQTCIDIDICVYIYMYILTHMNGSTQYPEA
jgi:hypothetical protein